MKKEFKGIMLTWVVVSCGDDQLSYTYNKHILALTISKTILKCVLSYDYVQVR